NLFSRYTIADGGISMQIDVKTGRTYIARAAWLLALMLPSGAGAIDTSVKTTQFPGAVRLIETTQPQILKIGTPVGNLGAAPETTVVPVVDIQAEAGVAPTAVAPIEGAQEPTVAPEASLKAEAPSIDAAIGIG